MGRGERAAYNSITSILSQVVAMISGFILPRLIMTHFGSAYNGITASVSQFLSIIALLRGGVGGATRAALYKSLAKKDMNQVSATVKATEIFMRKVAIIFAGFIIVFAAFYPFFVREEFDWIFTASLVLIISISTFMQYFFGITYQFLLQADQRQYVTTLIDIGTVILNVLISVVLINAGVGIHGVKLGSAIAFSLTPIVLHVYCKKYYNLQKDAEPDFSSIKQRWDAFFHTVTGFVHSNTDITLLTIFSTQKVISVYTTYYLVGNGIRKIVLTIASGVEAAFGDIIARNDTKTLQIDFRIYETIMHTISCVLFGAALVLTTPFIKVYTKGVTDVNYIRYVFGYLVIIGEMLYCLRSPYEALVNASGHFKETKKFALIETILNLGISIILVYKYDLIGVVIGTVISIAFRIVTFGFYTERNIIKRSVWNGALRFCVSGVTVVTIFLACKIIPIMNIDSYISWIMYAIPVTLIAIIITVVFNYVFYRKETVMTMRKLSGIAGRLIHR